MQSQENASGTFSSATTPREYALAGGKVVVGDSLDLVDPGYVVVRDGSILEVGEGTPPAGIEVFDVSGCLVLPGFINGHTHISDAVVKELNAGVDASVNLLWQPDGLRHLRMAEIPREEMVAGIRRALRVAIASGTVALADFREGGIDGIAVLKEAAAGLGIHALGIGRFLRYPLHSDAALHANTEALTAQQLEELDSVLDVADGFSPLWANDTTDVGLEQIAAAVRRRGKLLATHAVETDIYRATSIGRTGRGDVPRMVEHINPDFVVHMTDATDEELDLTVGAGIPIVMCARTQTALGYGIPPYVSAMRKGALLGLGTDNAMISSPDLLAELEFVSRANRSVAGDPTVPSARELLASVTVNAARMLHLDDQFGSLTKGKSASMVVIDMETDNLSGSLDPLASVVDRANAADVRAVLIDGVLAHGNLAVPNVPRG